MSNRRGIGLVVIVAIVCSVLSSFLTAFIVKDKMVTGNSSNDPSKIVVNQEGKTQNVYHAITEKAMPSVVGITTTSISRNMFAIPTQTEGVGTGIIVDSNGYILTNSHVVSDGSATSVNVLFNDGEKDSGKVIWFDPRLDLAIVKVDKKGLTPAEFADSDKVRVGDISVAIGNPLGLEFEKSVTQGIISGLNRTIQTENNTMNGLMQTDASINSGNSGGPLLNQNGQVIGINTAKASQAEGLGFAIPINTAKSIVEEVIKNGKYEKVTLGIKGMDLVEYEQAIGMDLKGDKGIYIAEVLVDSPAAKGNIQVGDIIVKVDGNEISTMSDLNKALYSIKKGGSTTVVVNRGGKNINLNIKF